MNEAILETARGVVHNATALGAEQVKAWSSRSTHVELQQRAGKLERVSEASENSLSVSIMVDGRYSSHSTSDLRPDALTAFLTRAVAGTRYLEPEPDRVMLERDKMGSLDPESLDVDDLRGFAVRTADQRRAEVGELEAAILAGGGDDLVSATAHLWDVRSESVAVFSNGFEGHKSRTWFGSFGEVTLKEPSGKLPEAYSFVNAAWREDLPSVSALAEDVWERATMVRDTGPCKSGVYPMILDARAAGRIIGAILSPLSGGALHQKRSIYLDRLGDQIGSDALTIIDDPTIPRGLGSRPYDGDGLQARRRVVFDKGVLQTYFLGVYHARKLGMEPTGSGTSNLIIAPGERSWKQIAADFPKAIRVTSFLGGNSNPASGDFSFGIRGQLLEHGEPVQNLSEMNMSGNIAELAERYVEAANDPWSYSSARLPTLLFRDLQFSGT